MSAALPRIWALLGAPPTAVLWALVRTPEVTTSGLPHDALSASSLAKKSGFILEPLPGSSGLSNSAALKYLILGQFITGA